MTSINFNDLKVQKLSAIHNTQNFDCEDKDINDFIQNDALLWQQKKLAVTHIVIFNEQIVGFYCTSANSIKLQVKEKETENGLNEKKLTEVPAVMVGRIGVEKNYKKKGLGEHIMKIAIGHIISTSESIGARFVTVDAYSHLRNWYGKMGFKVNQHEAYEKRKNISMRYCIFNPPSPVPK